MKLFKYRNENLSCFEWDNDILIALLGNARNKQGQLLGKMESLGFELRQEAQLETLTIEALKTAEIEGKLLSPAQVRSSFAKRLGINTETQLSSDEFTDAVVDMILDAIQNFDTPLTKDRLFNWYFPLRNNGDFQNDFSDSKSTISNENEMDAFIDWFNDEDSLDPFIKAGLAHLWFTEIHPFYSFNGMIARNIAAMILSKSDEVFFRFYTLSARIRNVQDSYKHTLDMVHRGLLDVTSWLQWFLNNLIKAISASEKMLAGVLFKQSFWSEIQLMEMNVRQKKILDILRKDNKIIITTQSWAKQTNCSADTALRDIQDLMKKSILKKDRAGGRSTCYMLYDDIS